MTLLGGGFFSDVASQSGQITVPGGSGINYQASLPEARSDLDLKFDTDGNEYVSKNKGAYVQRNEADCWLRPISGAPGLYEIRYTAASGSANLSGTTGGSGAVEDTWYAVSDGDFIMNVFDVDSGIGNENATFTIEIRLDDGPVLDSGVYTIQANEVI